MAVFEWRPSRIPKSRGRMSPTVANGHRKFTCRADRAGI
ncbi:hypothetical protein LG3211_0819 [Lysobacter gummosus]|nr:hypothetical protein LG3211_0819 [Lysobacter gummosus]